MEVAAHCFDRAAAPPSLSRAFDYKTWGIDLMEMPAGEITRANSAMGAYNAINAYLGAKGRTAEWAKDNPRAWAFVAEVIKRRKEAKWQKT